MQNEIGGSSEEIRRPLTERRVRLKDRVVLDATKVYWEREPGISLRDPPLVNRVEVVIPGKTSEKHDTRVS